MTGAAALRQLASCRMCGAATIPAGLAAASKPAKQAMPGSKSLTVGREAVVNVYGKVRVQITDAPRHIVIFDNGKRTRLYPVVVGSK